MKIKIKDKAEKQIHSAKTNKDYVIVTILTEDNQKLKCWESPFSKEKLIVGSEVEVETEVKKDRDGFDETWIKSPLVGRSFVPRNFWPDAYRVAIEWMKTQDISMSEEELDKWAIHFNGKFQSMNDRKSEEKKEKKDEIPF